MREGDADHGQHRDLSVIVSRCQENDTTVRVGKPGCAPERLLSAKAASRCLGVHDRRIRRFGEKGKVQRYPTGKRRWLYKLSELRAYLATLRLPGEKGGERHGE
jgi:hypothetical protein